MEPKLSIVLPNLNGAGWLSGSIESLYAQTEQNFELIIVDNGSTDESLHDARRAAQNHNCTLLENGENLGFSKAVNQGIALAKAPYVLLFNNDAFAKPTMCAELLCTIEKDARIFSVQCLMLRHLEPDKADDCGDFVTLFGWAYKRGDGLSPQRYQTKQRVFSACGGAAMYRKSLLDELGGFEEMFFAYLEDVDISWRANNHGYLCIYEPRAVCTHICGATTRGKNGGSQYNDFKSLQSGRNSLLLPIKNLPLPFLILDFPFLLFGYLVKCLVFGLRGYGTPFWQGCKQALHLLGKVPKTQFKARFLKEYLRVQICLFLGCFGYVQYRLLRLFNKK